MCIVQHQQESLHRADPVSLFLPLDWHEGGKLIRLNGGERPVVETSELHAEIVVSQHEEQLD